MNFAFISRHKPTQEQVQLAAERDIILHFIGDTDAFTVTFAWVKANTPETIKEFDGVVVVHPAAALLQCTEYLIGIFENANRAPKGAPPQFSARALHIYNLID